MPAVPFDLAAGTGDIPKRSVGPGVTFRFFTSGNSPIAVSFSGGSPFTDGSTSFTVSDATGVEKTTASTGGSHPYTAGDRTGDIDITVAF